MFHRGDRTRTHAYARDAYRPGIDAVAAQKVFQEQIRRGTRSGDAHHPAAQTVQRTGSPRRRRRHHQGEAGKPLHGHERLQPPAFRIQLDDVIEVAANHVGAAAEQSLERFRPSGKIGQRNPQSFLFIKVKLAGQRRRQVDQLRLAAHGNPDRGILFPMGASEKARKREYPHTAAHRPSIISLPGRERLSPWWKLRGTPPPPDGTRH
ncbi:MAG: hypothetical protein IANPNBLG_03693 [Bryobacteraceae bacterium]|nr:hypothetical protein [Bryobacteraceae bacterium]